MSASAENSDAATTGAETDSVVTEAPKDQKAAFKAALDRKNAANHARNQTTADGDNHVSGDSHAAGAKRVFRRKSG